MHFCPFSPILLFKLPYLGATEQLLDAKIRLSEFAALNQKTLYNQPLLLCKEEMFFDYLIEDIQHCKNQIIIYSPFMTEKRIISLSPALAYAIHNGVKVIVITKGLSERNKKDHSIYKQCEETLKNLGVIIYHKKGMHEKVILMDDKIVWNGSLNSLSFTGYTGEIMVRHYNTVIANQMVKVMNVENIFETMGKMNGNVCPVCQGEMLIRDGKHGGIFWQCINLDYKKSVE